LNCSVAWVLGRQKTAAIGAPERRSSRTAAALRSETNTVITVPSGDTLHP
jgi:hypothetical protein